MRQSPGHGSLASSNNHSRFATSSSVVGVASQLRRNSKPPAILSPRSSPEPEATDLEGNYLGPSSGISFLSRSWRRLKQDNISTTPRLPEDEHAKNAHVLLFGDRPFADKTDWSNLTLPPKERAVRLLGTYFDFSIVTYRFLHRGTVLDLLEWVYENNFLPSNPPPSNLAAKVGVIYMILAVGMLGEERRTGNNDINSESERCVLYLSRISWRAKAFVVMKFLTLRVRLSVNDGMQRRDI